MKRYMTGPEVAARLGLRPSTMRAWRHKGIGPPYQQLAGKGTQAIYDPDVVEFFATQIWPKQKRGGRSEQSNK